MRRIGVDGLGRYRTVSEISLVGRERFCDSEGLKCSVLHAMECLNSGEKCGVVAFALV